MHDDFMAEWVSFLTHETKPAEQWFKISSVESQNYDLHSLAFSLHVSTAKYFFKKNKKKTKKLCELRVLSCHSLSRHRHNYFDSNVRISLVELFCTVSAADVSGCQAFQLLPT